MSSLQQVIKLPSLSSESSSGAPPYLIFFIPGNPGPAAYYQTFLSSLHVDLHDGLSTKRPGFAILAASLSGMDAAIGVEPSMSTMSGEVQSMETALLDHLSASATGQEKNPSTKVILIGHGSGAYIALELLKRWRQNDMNENEQRFTVVGTICLFPSIPMKTISGTVSGAVLTTLSDSALFVHHSVKLFLSLVPSVVVALLLRSATSLSENSVKVTKDMVESQWGIYHALTFWRNQVEDQKSGRWDDAIYHNSKAADNTPPTLYMLFGQSDSEPEVGRGHGGLDPVAGIHKSQLPDHFFTTQKDSEAAAGLVKEYLEEIMKQEKSS